MMVVLDVRWECFTCGVYSKIKMGVGNDVLLYYSIRPVNKVVPWTGFKMIVRGWDHSLFSCNLEERRRKKKPMILVRAM